MSTQQQKQQQIRSLLHKEAKVNEETLLDYIETILKEGNATDIMEALPPLIQQGGKDIDEVRRRVVITILSIIIHLLRYPTIYESCCSYVVLSTLTSPLSTYIYIDESY